MIPYFYYFSQAIYIAQWRNLDNERFLRQALHTLGPRLGNPPLVRFISAIHEVAADNLTIIGCYPNPAENEIAIQYYLTEPSKIETTITDMSGKIVYSKVTLQSQNRLYNTKAYLDNLSAGSYIITLAAGGKVFSKQIVKGK